MLLKCCFSGGATTQQQVQQQRIVTSQQQNQVQSQQQQVPAVGSGAPQTPTFARYGGLFFCIRAYFFAELSGKYTGK